MTNDLDKLKRDYRDIEAPPQLAARIRAEVGDRTYRSRPWLPAAVTMVLAIGIALPFLWQQTTPRPPEQASQASQTSQTSRASQPSSPSLSALTSLTPDKPRVAAPNLSQLRSVSTPRMPPRPQLKPRRPQSSLDTEHENLQEKDHANA